MPIYEYSCEKCGKEFEELVFSAEECPKCPGCGAPETHKLMSCCRFKAGGNGGDPFGGGGGSMPTSGGSGCAGCSGGNCSTC